MHKHVIFGCTEWAQLSPQAKCLYQLMKGKRNPSKNDGKIKLSYREILRLKHKGLRRRETIARLFRELETGGWIKQVERGGLYGKATSYELTGEFDEYGI